MFINFTANYFSLTTIPTLTTTPAQALNDALQAWEDEIRDVEASWDEWDEWE